MTFTYHALLAQVSNGNMSNIVVCGEPSEWEAVVSNAGTVEIESLPPGIEFIDIVNSTCGASLVTNDPPTFNVPSPCTIRYTVQADCETFRARDELQGGNPNLVFKIAYKHNGNSIIPQDITAETNSSELQIELLENGAPVEAFTEFTRKFRVCNDGLDSYILDPLEICFDNEVNLLLNEVRLFDGTTSTPLTVSGNCVTINPSQFQFALDRNSVQTGTDPLRFEGSSSTNLNLFSECFYLELDLVLNSCASNPDFTQKISTNWGCNMEFCAVETVLPVFSNTSQDVPNLSISAVLDVGDGCANEHFFMDTIFIENTGQGVARDVVVNIETVWSVNPMYSFDIGRIKVDDGVNPVYNLSARIKAISNMNFGRKEGCHQNFIDLGGIEDATGFEFILPDGVAPDQTIKILVPVFFCSPNECISNVYWDRWEAQMSYTNNCGDVSFTDPLKLIENWFSSSNVTTPNIDPDFNDGDEGEISLDINNFSFDTHYPRKDWENKPFYELTFPCGISYNNNIEVNFKNGDTISPDSISWDASSGILYFEFDHPFYNRDIDWRGSQIIIDFITSCGPCGGGVKTLSLQEGTVLGTDCIDPIIVGRCYSFTTTIHCSDCPWVGINPVEYKIVRTNYGLTDANDDGLPDDGSIANPDDIRIDKAIIGDTIEGTWHAYVTTNNEHPYWEYGYASTSMLGTNPNFGHTKPIGAKISWLDYSTSETIICNNVSFIEQNYRDVEFDFSPATLCAMGCPEFCGRVYEDGDEIWLTGIYEVIDDDICYTGQIAPITVRTEIYGAEIENPPINSPPACSSCTPEVFPTTRFTCDNYTGVWNLIAPFTTIASTLTTVIDGCEEKNIAQHFYWGIGPGSSYFFNIFPNEYRPFGIWDTIYIAIPDGYQVDDWNIYNFTGTGNGLQNNGASSTRYILPNVTPDFIDFAPIGGADGSTVYGFDTKQYYENDILKISDDGGIISFQFSLKSTCSTNTGVQDTIEYWGKPRWLLNDQTCGLFGPRSPDYIVSNQANLIMQTEQQTVFGEEPVEDWPLRIISQNNSEAENVFIYIPPSTLQISEIEDNIGNPLPENNNIYEIGTIPGASSLDFTIKSDYLTCERDSFLVLLGFDCIEYPSNISDYECPLDSMWLYVEPKYPDFNLAILQPTNAQQYDLCEPITFEFQYRNIGEARAYDLRSWIFLPQNNADIELGSMEIEYPCGSGYRNWTSEYPFGIQVPLGTLWSIDITEESRQNNNIGLIGDTLNHGWAFSQISEVDNCFNIKFNVVTSCNFKSSEQAVKTLLVGGAPCGIYGDPNGRVLAEIENTTSITIAGTDPYNVSLSTNIADTILACSGNQSLDISLEMLDAGPTGIFDSLEVRLPKGMTYVSNTSTQNPSIRIEDGLSSLLFSIDPPLVQNETLDFTIEFSLDKDSLDCSENTITANSFTIEDIQCTTAPPNSLCNVYSATGYSESFYFIDKPSLSAEILTASTSCSTGNLDLNYEIEITNNSTNDIPADENFTVDIYTNLDGSCSIFGNSSLVKTLTINGPLNAQSTVSISDIIPNFEVKNCNLIAKINGCACDDGVSYCEEIIIDDLPKYTYSECFPGNLNIETCYNPEFSYTWVGIGGASTSWFTTSTDIHNPTLELPNPGSRNQTFRFEVRIDRGSGCSVTDTVTIEAFPAISEIYPEPNVLCAGFTTQLHGPIGTVGTWTPTTNLVSPSFPQTFVANPPLGPPITYTFNYTDANGCAAEFSEEVIVEKCLDLGDLPDTGYGTGPGNYETYSYHTGPSHQSINGLRIANLIDLESEAFPSLNALGDGNDEDAYRFLNGMEVIKGATYALTIKVQNITGDVCYLEIWVDWNGDGDFMDSDEFVFDDSDDGSGNFSSNIWELEIPDHAIENQQIGLRMRLSLEDNMTPYGSIASGEVEDYLFSVIINEDLCLPIVFRIK